MREYEFSFQIPIGESNVPHNNEFPWSLIDGIQIHEDADGHLFTFFDLLASAQTENMVQAIRSQAEEAIDRLRVLFTLELDIRDIDAPKTWDGMDELFMLWASERMRDGSKGVSPDAKARYAAIAEDEDSNGNH